MQVLTDTQWAKFEAAIAAIKLRGARPRKEDRRTIEAIIWRLNNGAKWRSIPAELGDWHAFPSLDRAWSLGQDHGPCRGRGEPKLAFACIDGPSRGHTRRRPVHDQPN